MREKLLDGLGFAVFLMAGHFAMTWAICVGLESLRDPSEKIMWAQGWEQTKKVYLDYWDMLRPSGG